MKEHQIQIKALGQTDKQAALAKLREFKEMKADLEKLMAANPNLKN